MNRKENMGVEQMTTYPHTIMLDSYSSKTATIINLITGLLTVVIQFAVNFFLSPFIVKHLGTEANGFAQLANNFVMYASLVTIAFNSMAARFMSVSYHRGQVDDTRKFYSSVIIINVAIVAMFIPAAIYIVYNLPSVIRIDNANVLDVKILFACVFLNFFVNQITSIYSSAAYVKNAIYLTNLLSAARTIANAIFLLVVFALLPAKIFYISAVATLLTFILLPIYKRVKVKLLPEVRFSYRDFSIKKVRELFMSGIWNTVNQCGHILNTGLDLLLANWFVSPFYMGVLGISKIIPSGIIQLAGTVNNNFSPSITQVWAKGDMDSVIRELRFSMKISNIIVSVPLMTFSSLGVYFYGLWQPTLNPYELAILSFLGCCAFIPVAGTQVLYNVFTAANKLKVNSTTFVLAGILNVGVVYVALSLFPQYGVFAIAGCSAFLTIMRSMTIVLPYASHILHKPWYTFYPDVLLSLFCALVNSAIPFGFSILIACNSWYSFIAVVIISAVISIIVDMWIVLNKRERGKIFLAIKQKIKL